MMVKWKCTIFIPKQIFRSNWGYEKCLGSYDLIWQSYKCWNKRKSNKPKKKHLLCFTYISIIFCPFRLTNISFERAHITEREKFRSAFWKSSVLIESPELIRIKNSFCFPSFPFILHCKKSNFWTTTRSKYLL